MNTQFKMLECLLESFVTSQLVESVTNNWRRSSKLHTVKLVMVKQKHISHAR